MHKGRCNTQKTIFLPQLLTFSAGATSYRYILVRGNNTDKPEAVFSALKQEVLAVVYFRVRSGLLNIYQIMSVICITQCRLETNAKYQL